MEAEEKSSYHAFLLRRKPIAEIAEILKLSPVNVKVKLHRIRKTIYFDKQQIIMSTEQKDIHNSLKQALKKRMNMELSSNFTYRLMQQIRLESERQYRRKR